VVASDGAPAATFRKARAVSLDSTSVSVVEPPVSADIDGTLAAWSGMYDTAQADLAYLLCDRHDSEALAFTFASFDHGQLQVSTLTYGELRERSARFASALAALGVARGDRVAVLMGKSPALVVALLGIWRLGAAHVPLFTAFATPAIEMRVRAAGAKVVITDGDQRPKLLPLEHDATPLTIIEAGPEFDRLVADHDPISGREALGGAGTMIVLYTSGTTGTPKGVTVPIRALGSFCSYMHYGLDVSEDDVFWNAADPGWAYGLYYGILGPLAMGRANVMLSGTFSAAATEAVITELRVTNFAAAPTVYRSLRKDGLRIERPLRRASSAGEPLTPDVNAWATDALGTEVRDHYGQTEHGMMIVNGWHDAVRASVPEGSMGRPLPGFAAGTLDGQIVLDTHNSPLMWFEGYADAPEKTAERFTPDGRWYLTGDLGREQDGLFYFASRDDDLIIMAGYRISPFEVESVLVTHPAVVEAAVVGVPDEIRGEVLVAYVVLAEAGRYEESTLEAELQQLVKDGFAAHAYPRTVHFVDELPKTPSGKVQRFVLRQR
jgi:acetyl-CoA synthetase